MTSCLFLLLLYASVTTSLLCVCVCVLILDSSVATSGVCFVIFFFSPATSIIEGVSCVFSSSFYGVKPMDFR